MRLLVRGCEGWIVRLFGFVKIRFLFVTIFGALYCVGRLMIVWRQRGESKRFGDFLHKWPKRFGDFLHKRQKKFGDFAFLLYFCLQNQ